MRALIFVSATQPAWSGLLPSVRYLELNRNFCCQPGVQSRLCTPDDFFALRTIFLLKAIL